jgi:hypothetical protein
MPSDYDYYLIGCEDSGEGAIGPPLNRWRFNARYGEFLRAKQTLKDRAFVAKTAPDMSLVLQYTGLTALDELVSRGRFLHNQALQAAMPALPPGDGPPPLPDQGPRGDRPPPSGPGSTGAGDRVPLYPREPVLAGAGARPLPREGQEDLSWWRT